MAQILVEEDFVHIDGDDMNVVLDLLDELNLEAEPTAPRGGGKGRHWELTMYWQPTGSIPGSTVAGLPDTIARIRDHFVTAGKRPPSRVGVYGRDGSVLWTFQLD
ncbi:hypothetical protein GCM10022403_085800 [Streptomyces coacervatus]|uniref:Uncharacterized protein n=1 Tax=Streptomyces coacervatus TaxID=647381 RepID=A0ABP7JCW0_9ACTN|nr:hypothetical protein [Streptomyces coacervatus]MDF2271971.1 hypothetical protein [Streptomyces coacervatus]